MPAVLRRAGERAPLQDVLGDDARRLELVDLVDHAVQARSRRKSEEKEPISDPFSAPCAISKGATTESCA